jgi:hypothetical protein
MAIRAGVKARKPTQLSCCTVVIAGTVAVDGGLAGFGLSSEDIGVMRSSRQFKQGMSWRHSIQQSAVGACQVHPLKPRLEFRCPL